MKFNQAKSSGQASAFILIVLVVGFIVVCMYCMPQYGVWHAQMEGRATLANSQYSKQAMIQTAKAKAEAAKYDAESEITRARGVATANKIIGESLHNNSDYLKYLWINQLENNKNAVIYIPTEANLPILEAGKRK